MGDLPYDYLQKHINSEVEVYTLNNKKYRGLLMGIDNYVNVRLNDAFEYSEDLDSNFIGNILINGGNVAFFNLL